MYFVLSLIPDHSSLRLLFGNRYISGIAASMIIEAKAGRSAGTPESFPIFNIDHVAYSLLTSDSDSE